MEEVVINSMSFRNSLIEQNQNYVEKLVQVLMDRMGVPRDIKDELISAGYLGLVDAADKFDPAKGKAFQTYAYIRIRGAIVDAMRHQSDLSPASYAHLRALSAINDVRETVESHLTEDSTINGSEKLAQVLEFASKGALAYRVSYLCVEEEVTDYIGTNEDPERILRRKEDKQHMSEALNRLPESERIVMKEYYIEGKSFAEIVDGSRFTSKSWVSKLHNRGLLLLKEAYNDVMNSVPQIKEEGIDSDIRVVSKRGRKRKIRRKNLGG